MAKRRDQKIVCTVELTEGAEQRITRAFVELFYEKLEKEEIEFPRKEKPPK